MIKPLLVVVTGRPASGKSTLAKMLCAEIRCPLISRDELKEGYIHTTGYRHSHLSAAAALHIYETFFETIGLLVSRGISIVVEAAFQDKLWRPKLLALIEKAEIRIVLCETTVEIAKARFVDRLGNDPERDRFHGDAAVKEQGGLMTDRYEPVNIGVRILAVDTTNQYDPDIKQIIAFIFGSCKRS